MRKHIKGFTLVELMIVVAVLIILMAIVSLAYNGIQGRSRDARRKSDVASLVKALELYYDDNGQYPVAASTDSPIGPTWYSTAGATNWNAFQTLMGGAIDVLPTDPKNTNASLLSTSSYGYAYSSDYYCGKAPGQWYIILYRLEATPKEKQAIGDCTTNPLGDGYFNSNGLSYYRLTR